MLLPHQREKLRDVLLNLSLLLQGRVKRVRALARRPWRATLRLRHQLPLRLTPLLVSFLASFGRGLRVRHVRLRSGIATIFARRRPSLGKEVPRAVTYLIKLPENDVLRLRQDPLQRVVSLRFT